MFKASNTTKIIVLFLLITANLIGQKRNDNWVFGFTDTIYHANCGKVLWHSDEYGVKFKFINTNLNFESTASAISDEFGNLLLYTNGCSIQDSSYHTVTNGNGLNPGIVYDEYCNNTGYIVPNGAMFLPLGDTKFVLLHLGAYSDTLKYKYGPLYYTVIKNESGIFSVVEKNKVLLNTPIESFSVIKHANGHDWWIIAPKYRSNEYFRFLLTETGFEIKEPQITGMDLPDNYCKIPGLSGFSPNGKKFLRYNRTCGFLLFDFDRCTGLLSGGIFETVGYFVDDLSSDFIFSPDSKHIYITKLNHHEYAINYFLSKLYDVHLDQIGVKAEPFTKLDLTFDLRFNRFYMDNDSSIYVLNSFSSDVFHYIDTKSKKNFLTPYSFPLPVLNARTVPYFANYSLSKIQCDSINSTKEIAQTNRPIIYPNPMYEEITINIQSDKINFDLKIMTLNGDIISTLTNLSSPYKITNLNSLNQGMYLFEIKSNDKIYYLKALKMNK